MNKLAVFLKVKQQSLALEAAYIKHQLRKYRPKNSEKDAKIHWDLKNHLKQIVAIEARATNIARAYLRGKPYSFVEPHIKEERFCRFHQNQYNKIARIYFYNSEDNTTWRRVAQIVAKYENNKAYHSITNRRQMNDVETEVLKWRDKHPQFFGEEKGV